MTPEQLHRAHVTAVALGQHETAKQLSRGFGEADTETAFHYVMATCIVALGHRFGDQENDLDRAELGRFITELRQDFRHAEPPLDYRAVEGLIRAIYGEDYLLGFLTRKEQDLYARVLLFRQVKHTTELKEHLDEAITKAQKRIALWLLDP